MRTTLWENPHVRMQRVDGTITGLLIAFQEPEGVDDDLQLGRHGPGRGTLHGNPAFVDRRDTFHGAVHLERIVRPSACSRSWRSSARPAGVPRGIMRAMSGTAVLANAPSGRFVLRLPPALHAELRDAARRSGLSLNEYCVRALSAPGTDPAGPGGAIAARAVAHFGPDLVGVLLFGSWARGEATATSDIDALVVVEPSRPITRALYREWDRIALEHDGHPVEAHLVGMPAPGGTPGTLWLEAALDGVVVLDRDGRIARHLGRVRRDIAAGGRVRRRVHGQPYWTAAT
jgi:uncharacterized protein